MQVHGKEKRNMVHEDKFRGFFKIIYNTSLFC